MTGDVYPVTDLAALPTSSALMFDLHVDFRCTLGLPSLELFARGTRPGWEVWGNQSNGYYGPAGASVQEPTVLPNKKTETDLTTGR